MQPAPDLGFARRFDPRLEPARADLVAVRFESDAALLRALALAASQAWVAECRVDRATRTLHLRLCSGAGTAFARVLH